MYTFSSNVQTNDDKWYMRYVSYTHVYILSPPPEPPSFSPSNRETCDYKWCMIYKGYDPFVQAIDKRW